MRSVSTKYKNANLELTYKYPGGKVLIAHEIDVLLDSAIRGLMRLSSFSDHRRRLQYYAPNSIPVTEYIKQNIGETDLLMLLVQIIEIGERVSARGLRASNILLHQDFIFVNPTNRELFFVYLPISQLDESYDLIKTIEAVIFGAVFSPSVRTENISRLIEHVNSIKKLSVASFNTFISQNYPEVVKSLPGKITQHSLAEIGSRRPQGSCDSNIPAVSSESTTTLLAEEPIDASIVAKLYRESSGESARVQGSLFRIGKDPSWADYIITGNGAVSRKHAEIAVSDGAYFLVDKGSTNKTYVEGKALAANVPSPLPDHAVIQIANERFQFHVDRSSECSIGQHASLM